MFTKIHPAGSDVWKSLFFFSCAKDVKRRVVHVGGEIAKWDENK